jgi:hypothetical protein
MTDLLADVTHGPRPRWYRHPKPLQRKQKPGHDQFSDAALSSGTSSDTIITVESVLHELQDLVERQPRLARQHRPGRLPSLYDSHSRFHRCFLFLLLAMTQIGDSTVIQQLIDMAADKPDEA